MILFEPKESFSDCSTVYLLSGIKPEITLREFISDLKEQSESDNVDLRSITIYGPSGKWEYDSYRKSERCTFPESELDNKIEVFPTSNGGWAKCHLKLLLKYD